MTGQSRNSRYYWRHREVVLAKQKAYYHANRERICERMREYRRRMKTERQKESKPRRRKDPLAGMPWWEREYYME